MSRFYFLIRLEDIVWSNKYQLSKWVRDTQELDFMAEQLEKYSDREGEYWKMIIKGKEYAIFTKGERIIRKTQKTLFKSPYKEI